MNNNMFGVFIAIGTVVTASRAQQSCTFPDYLRGRWYTMEDGLPQAVTFTATGSSWDLECWDVHTHPRPVGADQDLTIQTFLLTPSEWRSDCFTCFTVVRRSDQVLQYTKGPMICLDGDRFSHCPGVRRMPRPTDLATMFRMTSNPGIDCAPVIDGTYHFQYEMSWGGGGICNNPDSQVVAGAGGEGCTDAGHCFNMTFAACDTVSSSINQARHFKCLGQWSARGRGTGSYMYLAVEDMAATDTRDKFKCFMTTPPSGGLPGYRRFVMSRFSQCSRLASIYNGPIRLVLTASAGTGLS